MEELETLTVSLTKHGAYKIYTIMSAQEPSNVLDFVNSDRLQVHIDEAQARKNLSVSDEGQVPAYWEAAKGFGDEYLRLLVLLAICHSHHKIIKALANSKPRLGSGVILREQYISGKDYTNLAHNFDELGFVSSHSDDGFEYDFSLCFSLGGFPELFRTMLRDKLVVAGLPPESSDSKLVQYAIDLHLHQCMGMSATEYRRWVLDEEIEIELDFHEPLRPQEPVRDSDELHFVPGHVPRSTSRRTLTSGRKTIHVSQLHNDIQNRLYEVLSNDYGSECVGTEQLIGSGNRVDVVLKTTGGVTFYEIKSLHDSRMAVREALPQLMEYSYRPDKARADELIIVAPGELATDEKSYLLHLREKFGIPLTYWRYNADEQSFEVLG